MVVAFVIVELNLPNELNLDAIVFNLSCLSVEGDVDLAGDALTIIEQEEPLLPAVLILDLRHLPGVRIVKDNVNLCSTPETYSEETHLDLFIC